MSLATDRTMLVRVGSGAIEAAIPIQVMVAGGYPIVRKGLQAELAAVPDMVLVQVAAQDQVPRQVIDLGPDVLILDVDVPDIRLYGLLARLRALQHRPGVLILSGEEHVEYAAAALKAGAAGYLTRDEEVDAILAGVRAVAGGELCVSERLMGALVDHSLKNRTSPVPALTGREIDVLCLVAQGKYNEQIASRLGLSQGTVKNCVSHLFDKLEVRSRAELVAYAWQNRLVSRRMD